MVKRRTWLTSAAKATATSITLGAAGLAGCGPQGGSPVQGEASESTQGERPMAATTAPSLNAATLPGKLLYVADANISVWDKGIARRLTEDRLSRQPVWSPDGTRIAHIKIGVSSSDLWVMDADSANSRQLTRNESKVLLNNNWAFRPVWWPDGNSLLYLSEERTHDLMLWQISLDGRTRRPLLTLPDREGGVDMPSLSPDGKRLALVTYRGPGTRSQVWTYGLPNGPWRQLTEAAEGAYDPAWSPDGSRIAYVMRDRGRHDVWVMQADGAGAQAVTQNGMSRAPCWSPDGQLLAYCSAQTGSFEVWVTTAPALGSGVAPSSAASAPAARLLTRGAQVDAVSGLSWAR